MEDKNTIHIRIKTVKGSVLEKSLHAYLKELTLQREKRRESYKKRVDKQIKKIERSGL